MYRRKRKTKGEMKMGNRNRRRKRRQSSPYPTSTTLGDHLILAYNLEKSSHEQLQQDMRVQQMKEIITANNEQRVYRYGRDASPALNKMMSHLREKGGNLRRMQETLHWTGK